MKKQVQKFAASLLSALLVCGSFSVLPSMAESAISVDEAIDKINAVHTFSAKDIADYTAWQSALADSTDENAVAAKARIDNAVAELENADVYDDFSNFGKYVSGESYPENSGDIMPTSENTSNYDVIWAGLNEVDGKNIIRKPYNSEATYNDSTGTWDKRKDTLIGSRDNILHFSSFDVMKQYNSEGQIACINNRTENNVNPILTTNLQNMKFNLLTLKNSVANGGLFQKFDINISANGSIKGGFVIYDYTDINNWQAVSITKHRNWSSTLIVFKCIDGKLYKESGSEELSWDKYYDIRPNNTGKNVIDAAGNNGYVNLGFEYDFNNSRYNLVLSCGDNSYTRTLPAGSPLSNIYLGAFPKGSGKEGYAFEGFFDNLKIKYFDTSALAAKIAALPATENAEYADFADIFAVYNEYSALPESVKSSIDTGNLITLIDWYKTNFGGKIFNFEDKNDENSDMSYLGVTGTVGSVNNPYTDAVNSSEKVLKISSTNSNSIPSYNVISKNKSYGTHVMYTGKTYLAQKSSSNEQYTASLTPVYVDADNYTTIILSYSEKGINVNFGGKKGGTAYAPSDYGVDRMSGISWTGGWVDFRIELNGEKGKLYLGALGSDGEYYYNSNDWNFGLAATENFGFMLSGHTWYNAYYDDIAVVDGENYTAATELINNNKYILDLFPFNSFLSSVDSAEAEKLISDYASLSETAKPFVGGETVSKIDKVKVLKNSLNDNDLSVYNDAQNGYKADENSEKYSKAYTAFTAENNNASLSQFEATYRMEGVAKAVTDETLNRNVMSLEPNVKISLKDKFVPSGSTLSKVSYKIKAADEIKAVNNYDPAVTVNVFESDKYHGYLSLSANGGSMTKPFGGVDKISYSVDDKTFDVNTELSVNIEYSSNKADVTVIDGNGVALTASMNIPEKVQNRLTFSNNCYKGYRATHVSEVWKINVYDVNVIFGADGTEGLIKYTKTVNGKTEEFYVAENTAIELGKINRPTKAGFKFAGWATSENGTPIYGEWTPTADNNAIYAIFVECKGGLGDVNNNGTVDILDLVRAKKVSVATENTDDTYRADLDYDGKCGASDLVAIRKILLNS